MGKTMGEVAYTEQWCRLSVLAGWVLLQLSPLCTAQNQDTCFMTLVLPKEKVKHTCDVQEAVLKRLDALEGQIAYQKTIIKDLEQMLMKERDMKDNGRETAGTQKQTSDPQHKEPPTDGFQVDPGTQPIPDDEYFIPLPDLSDDYPDFVDYSLPDVEGRSGGGFTKKSPKKNSARGSKSGSSRETNLVAIELIRPYVHAQLDKLRANLTRRISQTVYPFAAGFEEVKKFLLRNQSQDSSALSPGAQTSMNTIALSHLFLQVSNLHNKLLHYNTHQIAAQKRVSVVERRLLALSQNSGQKTKDLQARITQLEHENQLLKINQSCVSQMSEMKLDISRQISEAKDNIRLNCKTRRRPPRNRARSAQGDYYYDDDEGFEDDNSIYDNPLPLSELEKNVTILQNLVAQHRHQLEAVNRKHGLTWNSTRAALEQESVDRELGDRQVNDTSLLGLVKVKLQVGELNELVQKVSSTAAGIQADMEEKQQTLTRQLAALKRLTTDLHEDTTKNFTWHSSRINNLSHSLATNIAALQKSDRELSLAMKQGLGRSNQRLAESSIRIKQNNNTLIVLSDELRSLSEQVHVTVLNLNESVLNLGVEMRLNNVTWIPYNFSHSMGHVKCYGEKYIKKTSYESGKIVGVVLCTKDMYKIFLSDSLTDTFLDIADSSGFGRDHCEFIGGNRERTALLGNTPVFYKRERGYKRAGWGEQPKVTTLWVMNPSPEWYRCGVSIPS